MHKLLGCVAVLVGLSSIVSAEPSKLHVNTDVVTWDKTTTEAQCLEKAKAAILKVDPKLTTVSASHAMLGSKASWVFAVDCLQSYKLNGAYITIAYTGADMDTYNKAKTTVSKELGGKSEMLKN